jgi:cytochrome c oxidase subunit II
MGLALLFVIWLITIASSWFFFSKTWWMPAGASAAAAGIDRQFAITYALMGIVFIAAQLALGLFVWKYRDKQALKSHYSHGDTGLELTWTVLTAILFIGLNLAGAKAWSEQRFTPASADAVRVEVTGVQFAWYFRYPGPDGKFAKVNPAEIDASAGNEAAIGVDTTDPAAADDVVTGTMVVPVDREVEVLLRAQDVIHSFYVPSMRFKQDAVPGLVIPMHFRPTKVGDYEFACAELCGLGHYKMHGMLKVVSQQDYEKWIAERVKEKQEQ